MDKGKSIFRLTGVVRSFDDLKGFGVITLYGNNIFVERSSILSKGVHSLEVGQTVEFLVVSDSDGEFRAVEVTVPNESPVHGTSRGSGDGYGFNEGYDYGFNEGYNYGLGYDGGYGGGDYCAVWDYLDGSYGVLGSSGDSGGHTCYKCGEAGHIESDCCQGGGGGSGCYTVGNKNPKRPMDEMDEGGLIFRRRKGVVISFDDLRGSGIVATLGGDNMFVERSSIQSKGVHSLVAGQPVEFLIVRDSDGEFIAVDVTVPNKSAVHGTSRGSGDGYGFNEGYGYGGGSEGYDSGSEGYSGGHGCGYYCEDWDYLDGSYGVSGYSGDSSGNTGYKCGEVGHIESDCYQGGGGGGGCNTGEQGSNGRGRVDFQKNGCGQKF